MFILLKGEPALTLYAEQAPIVSRLEGGKDQLLSLGIKTSAKSILVANVTSEEKPRIIFRKNSEEILPIASLTKLMTLLVLLDQGINMDSLITIMKEDGMFEEKEAQRLKVMPGDKVKAYDLFVASLIFSANNAIKALVRSSGIPPDDFIALMNKKAAKLGMSQAFFSDLTGLSLNNVSTASDLLLLAKQAFSQPEISKAGSYARYTFLISRSASEDSVPITIYNTDELLPSFLNKSEQGYRIINSKTGHLFEAGYHLIMKLENKGKALMIILLGSESSSARFQEAKGLAWWALGQELRGSLLAF